MCAHLLTSYFFAMMSGFVLSNLVARVNSLYQTLCNSVQYSTLHDFICSKVRCMHMSTVTGSHFLLCTQIRFVSTEKNYAHRLACILLFLMQKSILYAKIAISPIFFSPKFSFKYY